VPGTLSALCQHLSPACAPWGCRSDPVPGLFGRSGTWRWVSPTGLLSATGPTAGQVCGTPGSGTVPEQPGLDWLADRIFTCALHKCFTGDEKMDVASPLSCQQQSVHTSFRKLDASTAAKKKYKSRYAKRNHRRRRKKPSSLQVGPYSDIGMIGRECECWWSFSFFQKNCHWGK